MSVRGLLAKFMYRTHVARGLAANVNVNSKLLSSINLSYCLNFFPDFASYIPEDAVQQRETARRVGGEKRNRKKNGHLFLHQPLAKLVLLITELKLVSNGDQQS